MTIPERYQKLFKAVLILLIVFLAARILIGGAPFLLPISKALERKGVNKALSTILAILVLVAAGGLLIFFASYQVSDLAKSSSEIEKQLSEKYKAVQEYV